MYTFEKVSAVGFDIFKSITNTNQEHKKRFVGENITSTNQETFNAYIKGSFKFEVPEIGFSKVFNEGDTSFDLDILYPKNAICVERPLEDGSIRYCISATKPKTTALRYTHVLSNNEPHEVVKNCLVVVISGSVNVLDNEFTAGGYFVVKENRLVTTPSSSKIAVFKSTEF